MHTRSEATNPRSNGTNNIVVRCNQLWIHVVGGTKKQRKKNTIFRRRRGGLVCMTTNQSIAVAISHIRIKLCCSIQINAIQTASIRYSDIECTLWDDSVTDMLFDRAYAAALTPCKWHDKAAESSFVMNNSLENESINWPRYFIPYYRCCNTR